MKQSAGLYWLLRRSRLAFDFVRRRPVAVLVLLTLMVSMVATEGRIAYTLRESLFDGYQVLLPRTRVNDSVVIVAIDEGSLEALGQWPWPRRQVAELVERVAAQQPAAMAMDLFFPEPDRQSPRQQAKWLRAEGFPEIAKALAQRPDDDERLATALAHAPVVLGLAGVARAPMQMPHITHRPLIVQIGGDVQGRVPAYPAALGSLPEIDAAAPAHGVLNNGSEDGMVRGVPTLVNLAGSLQPGLALETLRLAAGADRIRVQAQGSTMRTVSVGDWIIPTDADGLWRLHYSHFQERPHLSASALLDGSAPADVLQGRIVLIGYTALGLQDTISTPLGRMPGVESHAEAIDNLLDGRLLQRPFWAPMAEHGLLLLIGLLALVLVPNLRPAVAGMGFAVLAVMMLGAAMGLFVWRGWLIDVANPLLQGTVLFSTVLVLTLIAEQAQRRRLREALAASREQQARLEGELDGARRIQMGMLPVVEEELGREPRIDLAACMHSARSVGGDLYDYGRLDGSKLYFLIGDVSGKGLPASLFMALSKALIRSAVQQAGADPGAALVAANAAIARDNPEFLFVTAIVGVLDLDSGDLAWCNAGHDAPYLLRTRQAPEQLQGERGPPLCVLDGFAYTAQRTQLSPGDTLVLVTDGITEAENRSAGLYGSTRLLQCLSALPANAPAAEVLAAMERDVAVFTAGAEQSDDLTALVLQWKPGDSPSRPIVV